MLNSKKNLIEYSRCSLPKTRPSWLDLADSAICLPRWGGTLLHTTWKQTQFPVIFNVHGVWDAKYLYIHITVTIQSQS